jgi:hypothetical protein
MEKQDTILFDANALPALITAPGFDTGYKDYVDETIEDQFSRPHKLGGIAVYVLSALFILVGAGFIIFGPNSVWVNRYEGPTFLQFLQLYPGPIVTVGFALAYLGQYLNHQAYAHIQLQQPFEFLLANYTLLPQQAQGAAETVATDAKLDVKHLTLTYNGNDQFEISRPEAQAEPASFTAYGDLKS